MKKEEFLKDYYFTFQTVKSNSVTLQVITGVIERKSKKVVDTVTTTLDISSINDWIKAGESEKSTKEWDWTTYIDQVKRFQLDYFAKRIGIDDYAPLNIEENGEIGGMYK